MNHYTADLHIHTALSPCADCDMTPPAIVQQAVEQGLDIIAICDHNAAANAAGTQQAAPSQLCVLAGIEITTCEEVHVVGLFADASKAMQVAAHVQRGLPTSFEPAPGMSPQLVLDSDGTVVGHEPHMLAAASALNLAEAVALIRRHHGVAIAAHVDRPSFSVLSQLGFFPEDVTFDALEISEAGVRKGRHRDLAGQAPALVSGSDAHFLAGIGASTTRLQMRAPTFAELVLALRAQEGRRCCVA